MICARNAFIFVIIISIYHFLFNCISYETYLFSCLLNLPSLNKMGPVRSVHHLFCVCMFLLFIQLTVYVVCVWPGPVIVNEKTKRVNVTTEKHVFVFLWYFYLCSSSQVCLMFREQRFCSTDLLMRIYHS